MIQLNFVKNLHFQGYGRGDVGGAHGGAQKWRGEWVGEFSHTWWGDGGALQTPVSQFVAKKMRFLNLGI